MEEGNRRVHFLLFTFNMLRLHLEMNPMYYLSNRASILATLCLLFLIGSPSSLTSGATRQGEEKSSSTKSGEEKTKKKEKSESAKLLWVDPSDIESRDLFYGIGGKSGAPDTASRFKFIERKTGGYSPKIIVEDVKG